MFLAEAVSDIVERIPYVLYGGDPETVIYALFNSSPNDRFASALCIFNMESFKTSFNGEFRNTDGFEVLSLNDSHMRPGNYIHVRYSVRSEEKNQYVCIQNHNPADECHNYLRVFVEVTLEIFLICGTNAYDPTCREYLISNGEKKVTEEFSARGICPYSPHFNVTSLEANGLFTATYEWDYGPYPIISKKTLQPNIQIRTPHKHLSHLSEKLNFVGSFVYEAHVYFFFSELIAETRQFSKVARVCRNDNGYGSSPNIKQWMSFSETRLICSFEDKIYFNQIQAVSDIVERIPYVLYGGDPETVIYALFNSSPNDRFASALCIFNMESFKTSFNGEFRNTDGFEVLSLNDSHMRPGNCQNYPREITLAFEYVLDTHYEMILPILSSKNEPLLMESNHACRYTSLYVDAQVNSTSTYMYDILYIATECGTVIKVLNGFTDYFVPILQTIKVSDPPTVLTGLYIFNENLMVISQNEIYAVKMHRCHIRAKTCGECVSLRDPYCAWRRDLKYCYGTDMRTDTIRRNVLIQNIELGYDTRCIREDETTTQKSTVETTTVYVIEPNIYFINTKL
ncbi:semaphorin-1A-like [Centruroides sculpturatus]|uniref:semaphorin-1A-like n=1 Tax=Centruroides sculpturatus TaxID=218467 RepID=UPI000C6E35C1|nr:semaphorin-1A-like [Centruroides sculpturatus]